MRMTPSRRRVLQGLGVLGLAAPTRLLADPPEAASGAPPSTLPYFPAQDPEIVRETVGASHRDLERVRELVSPRPTLANATWDWGFGDWETALGAASHTGQREIAEVLLAHGARPTLFSATMLGQLDVVRAFVEASPGIQKTAGPHGLTLLHHARQGGDEAKAVADYLESVGDADIGYRPEPLTDAEREAIVGRYSFGPTDDDVLEVKERKDGGLEIVRASRISRPRLFHLGKGVFHPAGAPAVRIVFGSTDGMVRTLSVLDPDPLVEAVRVTS